MPSSADTPNGTPKGTAELAGTTEQTSATELTSAAELTSTAPTPYEALRANNTIVLFDGVCHFCDSTVQFLLPRDRKQKLVFSPLQSEATEQLRVHYDIPEELDTIAVIDNGELFLRTDALLRVAWRLGGWWALLSIFWVVPRFLRDGAYCLFAGQRYRLFGQRESCAMPNAQHEARFLVPTTSLKAKASMEVKRFKRLREGAPSAIRKILPANLRRHLEAYRSGRRVPPPWSTMFYLIDVVRAVLFQFARWRVGQRAAGVAFFILIGFVPTVMMLVVATELIGLTEVVGEFVVDAIITNYIPLERGKALETINEWVNNARTTIAGGIGLVAMAFAALNAFGGLYALMNDLWQVPVRGRLAHKLGAALACLLFVPAALFLSTWLTTRFGGMRIVGPFASRLIAFALIYVIALLGLKLVIRSKVKWKSALIAAAVGAFAFELSKTIFAIYIREMVQGSWFAIYGAIFLFPVFLLWNLVTANIGAVAASLSWVIQNPEDAFYDAGIASPYTIDPNVKHTRTFDPHSLAYRFEPVDKPDDFGNDAETHDLFGVYESEALSADAARKKASDPLA